MLLTDPTPGGFWNCLPNAGTGIMYASGVLHGLNPGAIYPTYTLSTGCMATDTVLVIPLPEPILGITSIHVGATITLYDSTSGGKWKSGDTTVAKIDSVTGILRAVAAGTATIFYTETCTTSATITVLPPVAVQDVHGIPKTGIEICPNPATSVVTITAANKIDHIYIISSLGQKVHDQSYNAEKVSLSIAHLPPGVYCIRINNTETRKLVKE